MTTAPASPAEGQSSQFLDRKRRRECKEILAAWVQILFCCLHSGKNYGPLTILFTRTDLLSVHSMYFKHLNYSNPCPLAPKTAKKKGFISLCKVSVTQ